MTGTKVATSSRTITINRMRGPHQLQAIVYDGVIAVHEAVDHPGMWTVTHVATGYAIGRFVDRRSAGHVARRLLRAVPAGADAWQRDYRSLAPLAGAFRDIMRDLGFGKDGPGWRRAE